MQGPSNYVEIKKSEEIKLVKSLSKRKTKTNLMNY